MRVVQPREIPPALGHQGILGVHQGAFDLGFFRGLEGIKATHGLSLIRNIAVGMLYSELCSTSPPYAPRLHQMSEGYTMRKAENPLFKAFSDDHALLGKGFHQLGERLRAADAAGARALAARIDQEAGPHMAFEEADFYPALKAFLDAEEVAGMYQEHADGQSLLQELLTLDDAALQDRARQQNLLQATEAMQSHIADCGALFGAMGGLSVAQQDALLQRLLHWRNKAPRWLSHQAHG